MASLPWFLIIMIQDFVSLKYPEKHAGCSKMRGALWPSDVACGSLLPLPPPYRSRPLSH